MKPATRNKVAAFVSVFLALAVVSSPAFAVPPAPGDKSPGIAPINSKPHGKSYSEWAATWWEWVLENSNSIYFKPDGNPSQIQCVEIEKNVWLLFGTTDPNGTHVERTCTVPPGSALFFPLFNVAYSAWKDDPPETQTEYFARQQVAFVKDSVQIVAEIDGTSVNTPLNYYEESTVFAVNVIQELAEMYVKFGRVAGEVWEPSVDAGYYLFLNPLTPGQHTLSWVVTRNNPAGEIAQDLRYTVIVKPGK
jgi:hypothetical protein